MKEEHEGRIELTDWKEKWRGVNEKSKEGKKIRQEEVKENNKIKKDQQNSDTGVPKGVTPCSDGFTQG